MVFLADYFVMLLIFGFHELFFKRSWALRSELILQIVNLTMIPTYINIYQEDAILKEKTQLVNFIQIGILLRLLRIFSFLQELEQWQFFMKAVKVMRGPFSNLCFTLYSLYFFYTLIGMEIYGGKINTKTFKDFFELNQDAEIGSDYIYLNFNDFASGLITLFSM